MTKQVQFRRGTTLEHSTFTGALAEITVDTDQKIAVVHDGTTVGGYSLLGRKQYQTVNEKIFNGNVVAESVGTTIGAALKATGTLAAVGSEQAHGLVSIGGDLNFSEANLMLNGAANVAGFAQFLLQNANSGTGSSTDVVVTRNDGNASNGFGDFGINSSGFTGGGAWGDVGGTYLYSTGGTLAVGTDGAYALKLYANASTNTTPAITINTDNSVTMGGSLIVNNPTTTYSATSKSYVDAMTVVFGC